MLAVWPARGQSLCVSADQVSADQETSVSQKATLPSASGAAVPGLVWKVTGGRTPFFLAGSLHYLDSREKQPWPAPLMAAYQESRTVCFELDSLELNSARTKSTIKALGKLPSGGNLWRMVTPETRLALDAAVTNRPVRDEAAACHPWMAAMLISQRQFSKSGIHLAEGMETQVTRHARKDNKSICGLEPALTHFRNLSRLSLAAQEYFLCSSVAPCDDMAADLKRMERAWRAGDMAFLDSRASGAYGGNAELRATLLTGRNRQWLPGIVRFATAAEPTLVVVGCLHLCGPDGLPHLLRSKGFTVEPYNPEPVPSS